MKKYTLHVLEPEGSNGHQAAQYLGKAHFLSRSEITIEFQRSHFDIFEAVSCADENVFGVVPIENSTTGLVEDVIEYWVHGSNNHRLRVVGDHVLPISHSLLTKPETNLDDVKILFSHPQAFSQCRKFLSRRKFETLRVSSTAQAGCDVWKSNRNCYGAIASAFVAQTYGLKIAIPNIQDHPQNSTRFHLISNHNPNSPRKRKTILVFRIKNHAGSLVDMLLPLKEKGINMSSIHSIPLGNMGEFAFYMEVDSGLCFEDCQKAISKMSKVTDVKIIGSF